MSKSSDERIERHKKKQQDAKDAHAQQAQRAIEERERKDRFLAEVRAKFANDSKVIVEILQDFASKLDGHFHYGDLSAPPQNFAAYAQITGKLGKGPPIDIKLLVDEHGQLTAVRKVNPAVQFPGTKALKVIDATREQYENFILDQLGIEK